MYVTEGGASFGFCPGKATWGAENMQMYRLFVIAAENGALYNAGGLADQPEWFVDILSWFLPRYSDCKFNSRARAILGDGKEPPIRRRK